MKKSFCIILSMLVLFIPPVVFTSCSGSDSEDDAPAVESKNTKIEISFSGDYSKFEPIVNFYAYDLKGKGLTIQTEEGAKDAEWTKSYEDAPFSSVSAEINDYFIAFNANVFMYNFNNETGSVTITGKVYYDGKLYRTDTQDVTFEEDKEGVVYSYTPADGFINHVD